MCDPLSFDPNGYGLYCDAVTNLCNFYGRKTSGATCVMGAECQQGLACNGTNCITNSLVQCSITSNASCNVAFGLSPINGYCLCSGNISAPGQCAELPPPSINDCLLQFQTYQTCLYTNCVIGTLTETKAGLYPYDVDGCGLNCVTQANNALCCLKLKVPKFYPPPGFNNSCTTPSITPRKTGLASTTVANTFIVLIVALFALL